MPLLCQQGLPVSGSLALAETHTATSSDKMTFCHSLSSRSHPSSLLVPNWDGWMDAGDGGARRKEKEKRERPLCIM